MSHTWKPDTQRPDWPPVSSIDYPTPDPMCMRRMENSLRSSIQTANQEAHLKKVGKWCDKHGKVYHTTPMLPNLSSEVTAGGPRSAARGPVDRRPSSLIGGANGHTEQDDDAPVKVCIDWLTMTGPRENRRRALDLCESFFGESKPGKGLHFLNSGQRFGSNSGVYWDEGVPEPKEHCEVNLAGSLLAELKSQSLVIQLMDELLRMGFKGTRIDVATDFFKEPDLIQKAHASCRADKLTGAKTYSLQEEYSRGSLSGRTLYIGKRGKDGSGRFLRVYDKGKQTKTRDDGEWIRWEVVYSKDCARQVCEQIANADDPLRVCIENAMGVVDFREDPGRKLARRERCKWFKDLIGSLSTRRVTESRVASSIYTKVRWFRDCVAPFLQTAGRVTGNTVDRVIHEITGTVNTKRDYLDDPLMRSVCDALGVPPHQIKHVYETAVA